MTTPPTSSQTVGPFFQLGMVYLERDNFVAEGVAGDRITIRGKVLDGDGEPVPDAVLEIWQADHLGHYDIAGFRYRAKMTAGDKAEYAFSTVMPPMFEPVDGIW